MREFYFEDKVKKVIYSGMVPHNDKNCRPLDYFIYNHAYIQAKLRIQVMRLKGESIGSIEDFVYQHTLIQTKDLTEKILHSTLPDIKLQQILAHVEYSKNQQEKLWEGTTLKFSDLLWFNKFAQETGYLMDVYHIETHPSVYDAKKHPLVFSEKKDGTIETIGETTMSNGEMRGLLHDRKVVQARIYHRESTWHCFYFTFRGLAGEESGKYGKKPHYHYLSDKYGLTWQTLENRIKSCDMPSSNVHIVIDRDSQSPLLDMLKI